MSAPAIAQQLTPQQEQTIYDNILKGHLTSSAPPGFDAAKGNELPSSVLTNPFPSSMDDSGIQRYEYAVTGDEVVVADPKTRRIVGVIHK